MCVYIYLTGPTLTKGWIPEIYIFSIFFKARWWDTKRRWWLLCECASPSPRLQALPPSPTYFSTRSRHRPVLLLSTQWPVACPQNRRHSGGIPCLGCAVVGGKSCELPLGDNTHTSGAWAVVDRVVLYISAAKDCLTCNFYSSSGLCLLESSKVRSPLGHVSDLEVFVEKQLP